MDQERDAALSIRVAASNDSGALALVGSATMLETYADRIPGPDLVAHCANRHGATFYEAWLGDPGITIWLAETSTGAPAGYLVLMPVTLSYADRHPSDLEVQRIYVLGWYQGTGVGSRLMRCALRAAGMRAANRLVLGVMKANEPAVAFYHRQGFEVIGSRQFQVGASVFDDHIMGRACPPTP